jgi:hypothetical protein
VVTDLWLALSLSSEKSPVYENLNVPDFFILLGSESTLMLKLHICSYMYGWFRCL